MATTAKDWSIYWRVPVAYGYDPKDEDYNKMLARDGYPIVAGYDPVGDEYYTLKVDSNGHIITPYVWSWNATRDSWIPIVGTWLQSAVAGYHGGAGAVGLNVNDHVGFGNFYIPIADDYTMYGLFERGTNSGQAEFYLNSVSAGTIELYGASNNNYEASIDLGSLSVGLYGLACIISGKHASSSDYKVRIQSLWIVKT